MPRFENHESLDKFLNNMRLEIFNAEFNSLCNIAPDLLNPFFEQKAQAPEEVRESFRNPLNDLFLEP